VTDPKKLKPLYQPCPALPDGDVSRFTPRQQPAQQFPRLHRTSSWL